MTSLRMSFLFLFLCFIVVSEAGKKKKIIIHVPYKVHKHHHTHTNYKVIKVPEKKEKTIILYKQEKQKPEFKYVPVPVHQESPPSSEIKHFPTSFILDHPAAEASYIKGVIASNKVPFLEDNAAHQSNNNQYRTLFLRPMKNGYMVKEPTQFKNNNPQFSPYQSMNKYFKTPNLKAQGSTKQFILTQNKMHHSRRFKETENISNENQKYYHVGYLVIDGNSSKIVDKNFQNTVNSWR